MSCMFFISFHLLHLFALLDCQGNTPKGFNEYSFLIFLFISYIRVESFLFFYMSLSSLGAWWKKLLDGGCV